MKRAKKLKAKLNGRIYDWENMMNGKGSDIIRKHSKGFRKPGSVNK